MEKKVASTTFTYNDLCDFIEGATFFATGGGGPKDVALDLLMNSGISSVEVISSKDAADDMQIAFVTEVFAPSSIEKKKDFLPSLLSFEDLVNPPAGVSKGVLPGEVGAINSIVPAIVAALSGGYLIADTQTDRALPTLDMGLFQLHVPFLTLNMLNDKGEEVARKSYPISDLDSMVLEKAVEKAMGEHPELQGVGGFASYPMYGSQLKTYYQSTPPLLLPDTFNYARNVGRLMHGTNHVTAILSAIRDWLDSLYGQGRFHPYEMFKGYLVEARQVHGQQDHGRADFMSSDPESALGARIYYSNENMIAYYTLWVLVQGVPQAIELSPMAIGPDAVCYLLTDARFGCGYSFTNEAFTDDFGHPDFFRTHEIELVGIPEPVLRREGPKDILENFKREITAAKEAFGSTFDGNYIPIETLQASSLKLDIRIPAGAKGADAGSQLILSAPDTEGAIHFTLDGSAPDQSAGIYQAPIPFETLAGKTLNAALLQNNETIGSIQVTFPML